MSEQREKIAFKKLKSVTVIVSSVETTYIFGYNIWQSICLAIPKFFPDKKLTDCGETCYEGTFYNKGNATYCS